MAFTPEEADYYHDRGLMPDWAWVQQNGRSPEWNWEYQHRKMYEEIRKREAAKRREEAKKEIERQILDAIVLTMNQGAETVADAAADDIISSINAAFGGGYADDSGLWRKSRHVPFACLADGGSSGSSGSGKCGSFRYHCKMRCTGDHPGCL